MGAVMIKCPNTGKTITTGMIADGPSFGSSPVFFSRTFCPICRAPHQWFAKEAWVANDPRTTTAHRHEKWSA